MKGVSGGPQNIIMARMRGMQIYSPEILEELKAAMVSKKKKKKLKNDNDDFDKFVYNMYIITERLSNNFSLELLVMMMI